MRLSSVISRTLVQGRDITPLRRCCRCILQPQPTGLQDTRFVWGFLSFYCDAVGVFCSPSRLGYRTLGVFLGGVLSFCSDAVSVFYSSSRLGYRTLVLCGGSYLFAVMQLVYSTAPADWATGHSSWGRAYPCAVMQSVYSTPQADWAIYSV